MKITRIDLWHVSVPTPAPFQPAWIPGLRQNANHFDLVRLTTASGIQGWSAAPALGHERGGLGALFGPYLLGERADDLPSVRQRIREMSYLGLHCGFVEPACWDILGKAAGKPVYELLGGEPGRVRLYASTGELKSGPERAEEVAARLEEGFEAVKLRVHAPTLEEDVAQVRAVREAVGDEAVLGVDANQAWRVAVAADAPRWDYQRAHAFCSALADLGVSWLEEPLPMEAYDDLARLRAAVPGVDLTGGELNHQGLPEFRVMLERGCYDVYQPDAIFTGGIAETWRIIQEVAAAGARYSPHTWTNGVGFAVNLQLFAASPFRDTARLEYPLAPPGWVPEARDGLLTRPWLHDRGLLELPRLPGLGFEIDPRALSRHGHRFFTATPVRVAISALRSRGIKEARKLGEVRDTRLAARNSQLDEALASGRDAVQLALEA